MSDSAMPFIAVVGGFWDLDQQQPELGRKARAAARELGKELANAGFGLVVYFSDDKSLEPHVVAGYCDGLAPGKGAIRVRYSESQREAVTFAEEARIKGLFTRDQYPGPDWELPFYRSLAASDGVDGVVIMSGARSTLIAGQIAVARALPVLVVDGFGGSGDKIWNELARDGSNHPAWNTRPAAQLVQRLRGHCDALAAQRAAAREREALIEKLTSQKSKTFGLALAFVLLLAVLIFGLTTPPAPRSYPLLVLLGLVFAGATGSLIRSVLGTVEAGSPRMSALIGGIAGFVVGLSYLLPQLVGDTGMLDVNSLVVTATQKIQFASAVLVSIAAGLGSDAVFNRMREQVDKLPVGTP